MTREEAKNWLNKLYARTDITDEYGDMEDMQPYEEAVNMAINALHREQQFLEAGYKYDCWRLGARISDLRANGILIKTEIIHKTNKYGHKIKYGRYSLITAEQEA